MLTSAHTTSEKYAYNFVAQIIVNGNCASIRVLTEVGESAYYLSDIDGRFLSRNLIQYMVNARAGNIYVFSL